MLLLLRKVSGLQRHRTSGRETTVPTQPQDISAALQGMRREGADHEELGRSAAGGCANAPFGRRGRQRRFQLCDLSPTDPALTAFPNVYIDKSPLRHSSFGLDRKVAL